MSLIRLPLCLLNHHKPNRRKVKWDGISYTGTCDCCGAEIRRRDRGDWRRDWRPDVSLPFI